MSETTPRRDNWVPKLVALDCDGTLVAADGSITDAVGEGVRRAVAAGAHVVLATGRFLPFTTPVAEQLGLETGWLVVSNGAVIASIDPPLITDAITFEAGPAVRMLMEHLPGVRIAVEELGVGFRVTAPFPEGELGGPQIVMDVDALLHEPVTRVVLRSPERAAEDFLEVVERLGLHEVSYAVGYSAWLDIAPIGVTKASGLETVRQRLGIDIADTAAIGDGRNDLEMLQWAACGVAMGQSPPELLAVADEVTGSFEDDGAAQMLMRWFG